MKTTFIINAQSNLFSIENWSESSKKNYKQKKPLNFQYISDNN